MNEDLSYQVELIERVKKELGMSQSDISQKFDIGESAVSKWMKKKAKIPTGTKIALELMLENKEDKKTIELVKTLFGKLNKMTEK
jgi:transcriptional regulator with XRE-family HTH domain